MTRHNIKKGFTLVEMLLSTSILSVMILMLTALTGTLIEIRETGNATTALHNDITRIVNSINNEGVNSSHINLPVSQASGSVLSLNTDIPANSPTIFQAVSGNLTVKKGTANSVNLNSNLTTITEFTCANESNPGSPGGFRCTIKLSYKNPSQKRYLNKMVTFYASSSLK